LILVDTGPLVALFDPADASHPGCVNTLAGITEPLTTTVPVLTEAFHLLRPASLGAQRLMDFVTENGLRLWFFDEASLQRAFALMVEYADEPMDLADASLVAAAERLRLQTVFTIDRDFAAYRIQRGHQRHRFRVIP
jgi:hypothetical protein